MADKIIRITTLNSRKSAKFPWPTGSVLYSDRNGGQCCIGQQGRQNAGVPIGLMMGVGYPHNKLECEREYPEWVKLWLKEVPEGVIKEINKETNRTLFSFDRRHYAHDVASTLNDRVAVADDRPEVAVAGLRILWRWLGETQGERWVIRWLRDREKAA